jgi:acetyl-CoA carboxylase, biotin carboxylase subunit
MYCPLTTWCVTSSFSDRALDEFVIEGITTTITLHTRIINDPAFPKGHASTIYLERLAGHSS